jgi:hypothetical protein
MPNEEIQKGNLKQDCLFELVPGTGLFSKPIYGRCQPYIQAKADFGW